MIHEKHTEKPSAIGLSHDTDWWIGIPFKKIWMKIIIHITYS